MTQSSNVLFNSSPEDGQSSRLRSTPWTAPSPKFERLFIGYDTTTGQEHSSLHHHDGKAFQLRGNHPYCIEQYLPWHTTSLLCAQAAVASDSRPLDLDQHQQTGRHRWSWSSHPHPIDNTKPTIVSESWQRLHRMTAALVLIASPYLSHVSLPLVMTSHATILLSPTQQDRQHLARRAQTSPGQNKRL